MTQSVTLDRMASAASENSSRVIASSRNGASKGSGALHIIDPVTDRRWDDLVATHPNASVFHHSGWLRALGATYGYKAVVVTNAAPGEPLREAVPFCIVDSWITGTRLVSLPFADHCEPLLNSSDVPAALAAFLRAECDQNRWKYIELRPLKMDAGENSLLAPASSYWFHTLDLTASIEDIFRRFDKDSLQRRIRRAERENLAYEKGRSEQLLNEFCGLLVMTRRRHQSLPQPRAWFRNLAKNLGENLQIRVARKDGSPIAALLTLRFRNTAVYKYGCSNERYHHLAAMPLLFWKLIEESKAEGIEQLDFGRTDLGHDSLVRFKDNFGTARRQITYLRYPVTQPGRSVTSWSGLRRVCSLMPDAALSLAGRLAYRHMG